MKSGRLLGGLTACVAVVFEMKTIATATMLVATALVGLAFVPQAAAADVCVVDTVCAGDGEQYCAAHAYAPGSDRLYLVCDYGLGNGVCTAALYDVANTNNHGIACVRYDGCLWVAIVTNDDVGTGWEPIVC